jgi:hypothetical protein
MKSSFYPTGSEGLFLDSEVRSSFIESVQWCYDSLENHIHDLPDLDIEQLKNPNAAQIGFYYSLSTKLSELQSDELMNDRDQLSHFLKGALGFYKLKKNLLVSTHPDLLISNFSNEYFTEVELNCLSRWLDTEPDNSLNITAVTDIEFDIALKHLNKALNFIELYALPFHEEFRAITKEVILGKPSGTQKLVFGGVSSFALWGSMCLNAQEHLDWKEYFRSIIHEYSHNVLFAKAMRSPLVENPSDQVFYSPLRGSYRPMDGIYHAAFVSAREALAAEMSINHPSLEDWNKKHPETVQFLRNMSCSARNSFDECYLVLQSDAQLTELGQSILGEVCKTMVDIKTN